jgi:hypothetical protein
VPQVLLLLLPPLLLLLQVLRGRKRYVWLAIQTSGQ